MNKPENLTKEELSELDNLCKKVFNNNLEMMLRLSSIGVALPADHSNKEIVNRFEFLLSKYMTFVAYQMAIMDVKRKMALN